LLCKRKVKTRACDCEDVARRKGELAEKLCFEGMRMVVLEESRGKKIFSVEEEGILGNALRKGPDGGLLVGKKGEQS